jgi:putative tricarboxylic transport membrane protein
MNWRDIGASLFFILIGIGTVAGAIKLRLGTPTHPQPGFFPLLGGVFLIAMSAILMVKSLAGIGHKRAAAFGELRRPAILVASMAVYVGVLEPLGYVPATIFIGSVILWILGIKSWKVLAASSVGMSVGSYFLFFRLLGVELPAGVLEGIWIF